MLTLLDSFAKLPDLAGIHLWLLQELSLPVGDTKESSAKWQLLGHRQEEEEWRGVGIAYDINVFKHSAPWHRANAYKAKLTTGNFTFIGMSVHVPHHATTDQTNELLSDCYDGIHTGDKVIVGMDANEEFKQRQVGTVARTARGEAILLATSGVGGKFPPQDMDKPTHFPYNTALRPRRLDYLITSKIFLEEVKVGEARDVVGSDHEPVMATVPGGKTTIQRQRCTWGAKQLKTTPHAVEKMNALLEKQEDHHRAIAAARRRSPRKRRGRSSWKAGPSKTHAAWLAKRRPGKSEDNYGKLFADRGGKNTGNGFANLLGEPEDKIGGHTGHCGAPLSHPNGTTTSKRRTLGKTTPGTISGKSLAKSTRPRRWQSGRGR